MSSWHTYVAQEKHGWTPGGGVSVWKKMGKGMIRKSSGFEQGRKKLNSWGMHHRQKKKDECRLLCFYTCCYYCSVCGPIKIPNFYFKFFLGPRESNAKCVEQMQWTHCLGATHPIGHRVSFQCWLQGPGRGEGTGEWGRMQTPLS